MSATPSASSSVGATRVRPYDRHLRNRAQRNPGCVAYREVLHRQVHVLALSDIGRRADDHSRARRRAAGGRDAYALRHTARADRTGRVRARRGMKDSAHRRREQHRGHHEDSGCQRAEPDPRDPGWSRSTRSTRSSGSPGGPSPGVFTVLRRDHQILSCSRSTCIFDG